MFQGPSTSWTTINNCWGSRGSGVAWSCGAFSILQQKHAKEHVFLAQCVTRGWWPAGGSAGQEHLSFLRHHDFEGGPQKHSFRIFPILNLKHVETNFSLHNSHQTWESRQESVLKFWYCFYLLFWPSASLSRPPLLGLFSTDARVASKSMESQHFGTLLPLKEGAHAYTQYKKIRWSNALGQICLSSLSTCLPCTHVQKQPVGFHLLCSKTMGAKPCGRFPNSSEHRCGNQSRHAESLRLGSTGAGQHGDLVRFAFQIFLSNGVLEQVSGVCMSVNQLREKTYFSDPSKVQRCDFTFWQQKVHSPPSNATRTDR